MTLSKKNTCKPFFLRFFVNSLSKGSKKIFRLNIHLLLCSYRILIEVLKWLLPFTKSRCQTTEKNRNERQWMMIIQISSFHYLHFCQHKCSINTDLLSVKKHLFLIGSKCLHKHFVIILLNDKFASQSKIWLKSGYFREEIKKAESGWENIPDPILMRPLCWMKMVSHVRLPWIMGGSQECR